MLKDGKPKIGSSDRRPPFSTASSSIPTPAPAKPAGTPGADIQQRRALRSSSTARSSQALSARSRISRPAAKDIRTTEETDSLGPVISKKIMDALREDPEPSKSLTEIRDLLVGPVRRLHEARMEELITILEDLDRTNQASFRTLSNSYNDLSETCRDLITASDETNAKLRRDTEQLSGEIQKNYKNGQTALTELHSTLETRMQRLANELNQRMDDLVFKVNTEFQSLEDDVNGRLEELTLVTNSTIDKLAKRLDSKIDTLSTKTTEEYTLLEGDLNERMDDLAQTTTTGSEKLRTQFETVISQMESSSEDVRRRQIEAFADTFIEMADRLMGLRDKLSR